MGDIIRKFYDRALLEVDNAVGFQREHLYAVIRKGQEVLKYFNEPNIPRPSNFDRMVNEVLLHCGHGGLFD